MAELIERTDHNRMCKSASCPWISMHVISLKRELILQICAAYPHLGDPQHWAQRAYEHFCTCEGRLGVTARKVKQYARDPASHPSMQMAAAHARNDPQAAMEAIMRLMSM